MSNKEIKKDLAKEINEIFENCLSGKLISPENISLEKKGKLTFVRMEKEKLDLILAFSRKYSKYYSTIKSLILDAVSEELDDMIIGEIREHEHIKHEG